MNNKNLKIILPVLLLIGLGVYFGLKGTGILTKSAISDTPTQISWRHLLGLNPETGEVSSNLSTVIGKKIKMPGFMVPLEDSMETVNEFIFVPNRQACIHVPPPPPNQMVYVKMKKGIPYDWGPIWLEGILKHQSVDSPYGKVSFEVEGLNVTAFQ